MCQPSGDAIGKPSPWNFVHTKVFILEKFFIMDVFRKFYLVCVHGGDKEGDDEDVVEIEKTSEIVRPVHGVEAAEDEEQVGEEVGGEGDGEEAEGDEDDGEEGGGDVGLGAGQEAAERRGAKGAF